MKLTLKSGRKTITCKAFIIDHRKSREIENARFRAKLETEKAATEFPRLAFELFTNAETKKVKMKLTS